MNEGNITSTSGLDLPPCDYETHFEERQVEHSTALHSVRIPGESNYFVGPLARINLNRSVLSQTARQLSEDVGISWPCFNPYQSIVARAIEVVHCYEESLQIIEQYEPPDIARISYQPRAGAGMAATEAPRGLIYHHYKTDDQGRITFAKIVPPTSQNQGQIEADLKVLLPDLLDLDDATIGLEC
jgi:sulfhydrogenase subunit alpha